MEKRRGQTPNGPEAAGAPPLAAAPAATVEAHTLCTRFAEPGVDAAMAEAERLAAVILDRYEDIDTLCRALQSVIAGPTHEAFRACGAVRPDPREFVAARRKARDRRLLLY
jgi:hypothetical protein